MVFRTFRYLVSSLVPALVFTCGTTHPHFFKIERWDNDRQQVVLVSDFHRTTRPENKNISEQRHAIIDSAARFNAGVIVEDGMIYGDALIKSPSVHMQQGVFPKAKLNAIDIEIPLHGMHSLCRIQGIDSLNAEYRFSLCRPLDVYYEFFKNKKYQILNNFNDGTAFETYYHDRIKKVEEMIEKPLAPLFEQFKHNTCLLNDYLAKKDIPVVKNVDSIFQAIEGNKWDLSAIDYSGKLSVILTNYTVAFLDLEILHSLALFKNKNVVFICAGNRHIQNLKEALPQLGYKLIDRVGEELKVANGRGYIEPKALDVEKTLARFNLKNERPAHYFWSFNDTIVPLSWIYHV